MAHRPSPPPRPVRAEPGAAHALLESLVGLWDTSSRVFGEGLTRPVEAQGSVEKEWVLGGRFLREDLAGVRPDGEPYMGIGFLGYDNALGVFQGVWMSSGVTGLTTYTGTLDPAGRTLVFHGVEALPHSPPRPFRSELFIESADRHVLTQLYPDGRGGFVRAFEIVHTRAEDSDASVEGR